MTFSKNYDIYSIGDRVQITADEGCDIPTHALGQFAVVVMDFPETNSYNVKLANDEVIYVEEYHISLV